jgi:hypothetical protein
VSWYESYLTKLIDERERYVSNAYNAKQKKKDEQANGSLMLLLLEYACSAVGMYYDGKIDVEIVHCRAARCVQLIFQYIKRWQFINVDYTHSKHITRFV